VQRSEEDVRVAGPRLVKVVEPAPLRRLVSTSRSDLSDDPLLVSGIKGTSSMIDDISEMAVQLDIFDPHVAMPPAAKHSNRRASR
jgi:hypothetical protein